MHSEGKLELRLHITSNCGRDRIVVGFLTTYAISVYHQ